jgi:hypothetical protein
MAISSSADEPPPIATPMPAKRRAATTNRRRNCASSERPMAGRMIPSDSAPISANACEPLSTIFQRLYGFTASRTRRTCGQSLPAAHHFHARRRGAYLLYHTTSLSASSDRFNSSTVVASFRMSARTVRMTAHASRRLAMEAWLYRPCLVRDARIRSMRSAVTGPVDMPPCVRQRPISWPPIDRAWPFDSSHRSEVRCLQFPGRPPR